MRQTQILRTHRRVRIAETPIVAIPTVLFLYKTETVFTLPPILYVVLGAIGIMFALIGSYLGERIQLGPAPKTE